MLLSTLAGAVITKLAAIGLIFAVVWFLLGDPHIRDRGIVLIDHVGKIILRQIK
jgi:hypothetical protein